MICIHIIKLFFFFVLGKNADISSKWREEITANNVSLFLAHWAKIQTFYPFLNFPIFEQRLIFISSFAERKRWYLLQETIDFQKRHIISNGPYWRNAQSNTYRILLNPYRKKNKFLISHTFIGNIIQISLEDKHLEQSMVCWFVSCHIIWKSDLLGINFCSMIDQVKFD